MAETKHGTAKVNERDFEIKRLVGELVVVGSVIVEFQTAAHRRFVDMRGLEGARAWWEGTQRLRPSLNG